MRLDAERLMADAEGARRHAHAPYSGFAVGAALLADDGRVFTGVNVAACVRIDEGPAQPLPRVLEAID
jgi:cytidine deaminase